MNEGDHHHGQHLPERVCCVGALGHWHGVACSSAVITEDFVDDMGNDAFDSAFNHALTGSAALSAGEVFMVPRQDEITFNLDPSQFVQFTGVTPDSNNVTVEVEFFSDGSSLKLMTCASGAMVDNSSGTRLSQISKIRLQWFESSLTQVLIDVVPEPTSAFMLGAGALAFGKHRPETEAVRWHVQAWPCLCE